MNLSPQALVGLGATTRILGWGAARFKGKHLFVMAVTPFRQRSRYAALGCDGLREENSCVSETCIRRQSANLAVMY